MTKQEKLIVSAYTGILMVDWDEFHKFAEELLGRPIYTHEFDKEEVVEEILGKVKDDFMKLCEEDDEVCLESKPIVS